MILDTDQHITETITDVELTRELIEYLGWYTVSDRLGFKNEWTFFNTDYSNSHINYVCKSERFVFVYISKKQQRLVHTVINTYDELIEVLHDYKQR